MGAQAISNANLKDYLGDQGVAGFVPNVTYAVAGNNVTVTDGSTIPVGDTLNGVQVKLQDKFGNEVRDKITATGGGGAKILSSATLDKSEPLTIVATVITNNNIVADGRAMNIGAAGSLGSWDIQKNAKV